jgi:hypothetical protein
MPVLRGRPSRWRGIHHLVTSRKPDDLPQFDEAVIEMFCAAKQVAPSVSPMASDPGGAFALGHRAASWRLCRAKSMRGRILAPEPPSPWPRWGPSGPPTAEYSIQTRNPAPAKQYFAGERRPRSRDLKQRPLYPPALTWSGGDAAGRDPSAWRGPTAPLRRLEPPSDNRRAAPISRGIARATCCIACANVASAT